MYFLTNEYKTDDTHSGEARGSIVGVDVYRQRIYTVR